MTWYHKGTAGHETHGQSAVYDEQGKTIALVYDGASHAALITKAVNNHEALIAALDECITDLNALAFRTDKIGKKYAHKRLDAITEIARAAINKARGE